MSDTPWEDDARVPSKPPTLSCSALVVYNGNKHLLTADARTGEVTLCRYTATGYNCYL